MLKIKLNIFKRFSIKVKIKKSSSITGSSEKVINPEIQQGLSDDEIFSDTIFDKNLTSLKNIKNSTNDKYFNLSYTFSDSNFFSNLTKNCSIFRKDDSTYSKMNNKNLIEIAEMKDEIFVILKSIRLFSTYIAIPYNLILILYNISTYSPESLLFHFMATITFCLVPYFLTENFVLLCKYESEKNTIFVTKLNFLCRAVTRSHDIKNLSRLYSKNTLRPFAFCKDKSTNEVFSILKICNIKDEEVLFKLIPEKIPNIRRKEEFTQRLIDQKMHKSRIHFGNVINGLLCVPFFFGYLFWRYRRNNPITKQSDEFL